MRKPFLSDWSIILLLFTSLMGALGWIGCDLYKKYKEHQTTVVEAVPDKPSEMQPLTDLPAPHE